MSVMLYKHPGPHNIHEDMFDYVIVEESAVDAALKDGWCKTTDEAKSGVKPVAKRAGKVKAEE